MDIVKIRHGLTDDAVFALVSAARQEASRIGEPQCIVIVDGSGVTLAQFRMDGAKYLSLKSAMAKARTAASIGKPSAVIPEGVRIAIASATGGDMTGLPGGLPIIINGEILGGIGIGSGRGEEDVQVAMVALQAIGGELPA